MTRLKLQLKLSDNKHDSILHKLYVSGDGHCYWFPDMLVYLGIETPEQLANSRFELLFHTLLIFVCFCLAVHGKPVLFWKGISGLKFPCFLFYLCLLPEWKWEPVEFRAIPILQSELLGQFRLISDRASDVSGGRICLTQNAYAEL